MTKKKKWNKKDIPDLTGKIILVTGANSGTGFEFSKIVASHNGHVILACRNLEKGENAKKKIIKQIPNASLDLIKLDLSDLSSVREFSDIVKQKYEQIDILCNNAGIMLTPQIKTVDGFDIQFGTNHLGHYALTGLLFEILAPDARIVNMSSSAQNYGDIHFDDINLEKSFGSLKAYGQSKLANMLFTYELDRKIKGKK
ncbi:MAG: SDR family NAD(P)-dependent oxidoreductase [Candidatus Heimdallarchaeota archaeon]